METLGRILLVEDDHRDVELSLTALEEFKLANEVVVARDGQQALDYLYCRGDFESRVKDNPAVILLDLFGGSPKLLVSNLLESGDLNLRDLKALQSAARSDKPNRTRGGKRA